MTQRSLARVESERVDRLTLIRIRGEIDLSNTETVGAAILSVVAGAEMAAIDLSAVDYLDSQDIHLLIDLSRGLAQEGIELSIIAPSTSIAGELMAVTKLGDLLRVREALPG